MALSRTSGTQSGHDDMRGVSRGAGVNNLVSHNWHMLRAGLCDAIQATFSHIGEHRPPAHRSLVSGKDNELLRNLPGIQQNTIHEIRGISPQSATRMGYATTGGGHS